MREKMLLTKSYSKVALSIIAIMSLLSSTSAYAEPSASGYKKPSASGYKKPSASGYEKPLAKEGKQLIMKFAGELKSQLQSAVKEGGLVNGISVCSIQATGLAMANSSANWQISRTSLKPRNPDNQPSSEEMMVLLQFEQGLKAGEKISDLVYKQKNADGSFHMMKAIPTQSLCLACHGQSISAEVQKVLNEKYPQDKATGYQEGEIRGAFSLKYTP